MNRFITVFRYLWVPILLTIPATLLNLDIINMTQCFVTYSLLMTYLWIKESQFSISLMKKQSERYMELLDMSQVPIQRIVKLGEKILQLRMELEKEKIKHRRATAYIRKLKIGEK